MSYPQIWVCKLLQLIGLTGRIWSINSIIQILGADSPGILVCLASILFPDCHIMHRNANDKVVTTKSTILSGQRTGTQRPLWKVILQVEPKKNNNGQSSCNARSLVGSNTTARTWQTSRSKSACKIQDRGFLGEGFFRLFHGVFGQFHGEGDLCCNRRLDSLSAIEELMQLDLDKWKVLKWIKGSQGTQGLTLATFELWTLVADAFILWCGISPQALAEFLHCLRTKS